MRLLTNYNVEKQWIYIITVPGDQFHEAIDRAHAYKSHWPSLTLVLHRKLPL